MSNKLYGVKIDLDDDTDTELAEIRGYVDGGYPVILTEELEDLESFGIHESEITIVEREEE